MAIISPKPKSFQELIHNKYYKVPLYQRPYDWEIEQVSDLWDDIYKNEAGYFLGTIVLRSEAHDRFEVVDGQQRLVTLLLLLRGAVETIKEIGDEATANEFQKDYIIQRPAGIKEGKLTLILSKRDMDRFEKILLGEEFLGRQRITSWKRLEGTLEFFKKEFDELGKDRGKDGIIEFINEKVLRLLFLEIILDTDSDVFQFFETLNDRGMDLSIADLVKNRVCGMAAKQQKISVEESASTIDGISSGLGAGKLKMFLIHYCWANDEGKSPTPRKKLMDWYHLQISNEKNIKNFLDHLEEHAIGYYINFINPSNCADKEKKLAFNYLDALNATRCYPLLLAGESLLKKKDFLRLCRAIEILTFRHSAILKWDAKVLEGFYFNIIKFIKMNKPIGAILEKFKKEEAMKVDDQFKLAFNNFVVPNFKVARYILWKIEEELTGRKQIPLDWNQVTVEHILARKLEWEEREECLNRLGNLTLLSSKMNNEASNKPFKQKREEIFKNEKRVFITKELKKYHKFTRDDIISRQTRFTDYALRIWGHKNIY